MPARPPEAWPAAPAPWPPSRPQAPSLPSPPNRGARRTALAALGVALAAAVGLAGIVVLGGRDGRDAAASGGLGTGRDARRAGEDRRDAIDRDGTARFAPVPTDDACPWTGPSLGDEASMLDAPRLAGCRLVALDLDAIVGLTSDGSTVLWRLPCAFARWASVIRSGAEGIEVAVCDGAHTAFDETGEALWSRPVRGSPNRVRIGATTLLLQTDGQGITVVDLATGETLFEIDEPLSANATADEDHVYTSTDLATTAYDLATGEVVWTAEVPASGLIAASGTLVARTTVHDVRRLDPATGEVLATSAERRYEALTWSDFVHTSDRVAVLEGTTGDQEVSVYDITTAELLWTTDGGGSSAVGGGEGFVTVVDADGFLSVHDEVTGEVVLEAEDVAIVPAVVHAGHVTFLTWRSDGIEVRPVG